MPPSTALPPPPAGKHGWPWTAPSPPLHPPFEADAWPLVTIVTPSYQQAPFLEETLRSVLLQDYPNLEYIVLDGGSRDGSLAIIQRYAPWLAHWVSQPDGGQAHALDAGFRRARGQFVAWLNSDDLLLPGALARMVAALQANPAATLVHGLCQYIDETGRIVKTPAERKSGGIPTASPSLAHLLEHGGVIRQPTVLIRHAPLARAGYLDPSLHYGMDYDLWIRLRQQGPFAFLGAPPLARFRLQPAAKTHALPLPMIGEIYTISHRHGGSGLAPALRTLRLRWHDLAQHQPAAWPGCLLDELASPAFRALPGPLRAAAQPLATELLLSQGFRLAASPAGPPTPFGAQGRACLRRALRRRPQLILNRGLLAILLRPPTRANS